ncbi:GT253 glycosyltransferase, partial [Atractosteus spatula]|nr:GT253 glycosyltransferase [Atractosteus spatula]
MPPKKKGKKSGEQASKKEKDGPGPGAGSLEEPLSELSKEFYRVQIRDLEDRLESEKYKEHFPNRNLQVYSTRPLLVQPCHYAGDPQWVSDTETSTLWDDDSVRTDWRGSHKTLKGSPPSAGLQNAYRDEL